MQLHMLFVMTRCPCWPLGRFSVRKTIAFKSTYDTISLRLEVHRRMEIEQQGRIFVPPSVLKNCFFLKKIVFLKQFKKKARAGGHNETGKQKLIILEFLLLYCITLHLICTLFSIRSTDHATLVRENRALFSDIKYH